MKNHKKKLFITKLKSVDNKKISKFTNTSESSIIMWKKENSPKKGLLLSAAIGYYLFSENKPIIEELKNNLNSLKSKLDENSFQKVREEIVFFEDFIRDMENIKETVYY